MNKELHPTITKDTIMVDESCQKIILACKNDGNYIRSLKKSISEIALIEEKRINYRVMYHWLMETFQQLNKTYLFKMIIDEIISPSVWYENLPTDERLITVMCSELAMLQINESDGNGGYVALVDMSAVY